MQRWHSGYSLRSKDALQIPPSYWYKKLRKKWVYFCNYLKRIKNLSAIYILRNIGQYYNTQLNLHKNGANLVNLINFALLHWRRGKVYGYLVSFN